MQTNPSPLAFRTAWESGFPPVLIHASESSVKHHHSYAAAKIGDLEAASILVSQCVNSDVLVQLKRWSNLDPVLISVHAEEAFGRNAIPEVMADVLAAQLHWALERDVVQANVVNHTGADGFTRLARQAVFEGAVTAGCNYVIVDDFIGQGGTIANLRGHIIHQGGHVIGATVLTGKDFSAEIAVTPSMLNDLRKQHAKLEIDWQQHFGWGFECLTQSEARYLERTPDAQRIRDRVFTPA